MRIYVPSTLRAGVAELNMEIALDDLTVLHSRLVNIKASLKNLKDDMNRLENKVDEAYQML